MSPQRRRERLQASPIRPTRPMRVALNFARVQQLCDGQFDRLVTVNVKVRPSYCDVIDYGPGSHDVAQPQPRCEYLREGADIHDDSVHVDGGEGQNWATGEMKFVVIVVFNNGNAVGARKLQQLQSACGRHGDRCRKLMVW